MTISTTVRGIALAAAAATALLVGACGSDAAPATTSTPPPPSASAPADPIGVRDMWVKTADKGMTAAFGTLLNTGGADIHVVKATSTASPMMELHEVAEVAGKMEMRPKEGGFAIPAGGSHQLEPGGDHLMMLDIKAPVKAGDEVTFTLTLDDGKTFEFTAVAKDFAGGNESYNPGAGASPMTMG